MNNRRPIRSFNDLEVYQNTYKASIVVSTKLIPKLPQEERYDLCDQIRRSCKAIPRLIAEGFAKKHQRKGFCKYLDDALAESNEMIVCLNHCKDLYSENVNPDSCKKLIDLYDKSSKQIYKLSVAWRKFSAKDNVDNKR